MIKKTFFSILCLTSACQLSADNTTVGLGKGLTDALNETLTDGQCYELLGKFIDLYFNKVSFTQEQWRMLREIFIEARELLVKRADKKLLKLQAEYDREYQELFEAIFDKETGKLQAEGSQEFLREALIELQNDERFEPIRALQRDEQAFNQKVVACILADLTTEINNLSGDKQSEEKKVTIKYSHMKTFTEQIIKSIDSKLAR